jgi:hypothetical protein
MRNVVALVILISTSAFAAEEPYYRGLDVHALLDSITDAQRAQYHIAIAKWQPAVQPTPTNPGAVNVDHAYILGSLEGVATYNADGTIVTAGLSILPTTYLLRIPASWNGRVVFFGPPGFRDHLFFSAHYAELMLQGYATAMVNAAVPGDRAFQPYEAFIGAYRTHDTVAGVFSTAHLVKDLLGVAFAFPLKTYALSLSGGTLWFAGLNVGRRGNPIDGYVMVVGGNGWRTETDEHMRAYRTAIATYPNDPIPNVLLKSVAPLSGALTEPTLVPLPGAAFKLAIDTEIGVADPEYRAYVLALPEARRYEALAAYHSTERPAAVQRAWDELTYNPDLQAPVIVVQGTNDGIQYTRNSLVFTKRVIDAGRNDRLRLYMIKGFAHMFPATARPGLLDAVDQMKRWVEEGDEPGTINFGTATSPNLVRNNWQLHLENDPCAYFHHQFDPEVQPPADCELERR